jgi:SNF2 family DNA or RNA helicase
MAHGITLTAASVIIWYAPLIDLEIYEQANARIVRPGQDANHVSIRHLVGTKTEQLAYRRLANRQEVQSSLLELFEEED